MATVNFPVLASRFHAHPRFSLVLESIAFSIQRRRRLARREPALFLFLLFSLLPIETFMPVPTLEAPERSPRERLKSSANVAEVRLHWKRASDSLNMATSRKRIRATVSAIFRVIGRFPPLYGIMPDEWVVVSFQSKENEFPSALH